MSFVLRLLNRRCGNLPIELITQIQSLSVEQLEALGEAILDFENTKRFGTVVGGNKKVKG